MSRSYPHTLPVLTSIVGFGALSAGFYCFVRPSNVTPPSVASATIYGIPIPVAEQSSTSKSALPTTEPQQLTPGQKLNLAYVYAYGVRNLSMGTAVIALSYFYAQQASSPLVRKCLGIVLCCGAMTPVGDMVVTGGMDHDVGRRASIAHALRTLVWLGFGARCLW